MYEIIKKEEAIEKAIKALQSNAKRTASGLGVKIKDPKRIFVTSKQAADIGIAEGRDYSSKFVMKAETFVRKSFSVDSEVVDHIEISSVVSGIYQIE